MNEIDERNKENFEKFFNWLLNSNKMEDFIENMTQVENEVGCDVHIKDIMENVNGR